MLAKLFGQKLFGQKFLVNLCPSLFVA